MADCQTDRSRQGVRFRDVFSSPQRSLPQNGHETEFEFRFCRPKSGLRSRGQTDCPVKSICSNLTITSIERSPEQLKKGSVEMFSSPGTDAPIRAGIFGDPDHVEEALNLLRDNGFSSEEISVVTTVATHQKRFATYLEPSRSNGNAESKRLTRVGAASLGLGGAAALTTLITTGGASVFVIGAFSGVALLGTFVALMMTRGLEKETADFFDQELDKGNILVAVEVHEGEIEQRLHRAEEILQQSGSQPISLEE